MNMNDWAYAVESDRKERKSLLFRVKKYVSRYLFRWT